MEGGQHYGKMNQGSMDYFCIVSMCNFSFMMGTWNHITADTKGHCISNIINHNSITLLTFSQSTIFKILTF
jgi:hypothetical protein